MTRRRRLLMTASSASEVRAFHRASSVRQHRRSRDDLVALFAGGGTRTAVSATSAGSTCIDRLPLALPPATCCSNHFDSTNVSAATGRGWSLNRRCRRASASLSPASSLRKPRPQRIGAAGSSTSRVTLRSRPTLMTEGSRAVRRCVSPSTAPVAAGSRDDLLGVRTGLRSSSRECTKSTSMSTAG